MNRSIIKRIGAVSLILMMETSVSIMFTGCNDDTFFVPVSGNRIQFSMSLDDDKWETRTDSCHTQETRYYRPFMLQGENPSDTLFVHKEVSRGIHREDFAALENERDNTESGIPTRGNPASEISDYSSFSLYGISYRDEWNDENCMPEFIYGAEFKPVADTGAWASSSGCAWPGDRVKARYFAYAPINDNAGIKPSSKEQTGVPTLTYTVPSNPQNQPDLIVASTGEIVGEPSATPHLLFEHTLTAVKFTANSDLPAGSITQIAIGGISLTATRDMENGGEWKDYAMPSKFIYNCNVAIDPTRIDRQSILGGETTLMMIPQTLPEEATIEVTYKEKWSGKTVTLSASVGTEVWEPGTTVNYIISSSRILVTHSLDTRIKGLARDPNNLKTLFSIDASSKGLELAVSSFTTTTVDGEIKYISQPWKLEYVEGNEDDGYRTITPDWIDLGPGGGNSVIVDAGVGYCDHVMLKILKQFSIGDNTHTKSLRSMVFKSEIINLAGEEGRESTANCYVVNGPGNYKFPLYCGNGLKNGEINEKALFSPNGYAYVGYDGKPINEVGPAIENAFDAISIWQDVENLVTNIQLDERKKYITFTVNQETIEQGNAMIGVTNEDGTIMWSWHIWVTDFDPYNPKDGYRIAPGSDSYKFMSQLLGWCDIASYEDFKPRSVLVRLTQTNTGKQHLITISQDQNRRGAGNCTFYQWGRKDPFRGTITDDAIRTAKNYYNYPEKYKPMSGKYEDLTDVSNLIKYPNAFTYGNYLLQMENRDLWCPDYKTVYDPSPKGFRVPDRTKIISISAESVIGGYTSYYGCSLPFYLPDKVTIGALFIPNITYIRSATNDKYQYWGTSTYTRLWSANVQDSKSKIAYLAYYISFSNEYYLRNTSYTEASDGLGIISVVDE
ncbi:MAG: fimbrillin family protein [Muribaculum sp.]|nr:fimbrillin family protein [Muribaculum sp.]